MLGSTTPVRRGGAELQERGPRKCNVREQGPQFCCRSGAVGAMKAAEVHGARGEYCYRSRYMARGPSFAAVAGTWREGRVLLP